MERQMFTRTCSFIAVLLFFGTTLAKAQDSHPHQGFWIGFGLGAGASLEGAGDAQAGGDVYLRLGGTPNPKWLIGGEVIGWGRSENDVTLGRGNTTFTVLFYPGAAGGFYAKAGVGMAYVSLSGTAFGLDISATDEGFGSTLGLGYDIRLGENLFLVPAFDWLLQVYDSGATFDSTNSIFMLSLGLTWH
jgi:hypothetical protein